MKKLGETIQESFYFSYRNKMKDESEEQTYKDLQCGHLRTT